MRLRSIILLVALATSCNLFQASETTIDEDFGSSDVADAGRDGGDSDAANNGVDLGSNDLDVPDMPASDMPAADMAAADMATSDMPPDMSVPDMGVDVGDDMGGDVCGDGVVGPSEDCEPTAASSTCVDLGHDGGTLRCDSSCRWDETACHTCDYFFAPESGNDAASGTTAAEAWRTAAQFDSLMGGSTGAAPGDVICLRRGEQMFGSVDMTRSGTSAAPIVISHYGDPAQPPPNLTVSIELPAAGWTNVGGDIYSHPYVGPNNDFGQLWHGDVELTGTATAATLTDGDVFWDGAIVYIRLPGGVSETVYLAENDEIFDIEDGANWLELRGLTFSHGEHAVVLNGAGTAPIGNITIEDCAFDHFDDAIRAYVNTTIPNVRVEASTFDTTGNGFLATAPSNVQTSGLVFRDNVLRNAVRPGSAGIEVGNPHDCVITGNQFQSPDDRTSAAIILRSSGPASNLARNVIAGNYVNGHRNGIRLTSGAGDNPAAVDLTIANNILVGQGEDAMTFDNVCPGNGANLIAHNTVVDAGDDGVNLSISCGWVVMNNLFVDSTAEHVDFTGHTGGQPVVVDQLDTNVFAGTGDFEISNVSNSFAQWQAAGFDANSLAVGSWTWVVASPSSAPDYLLPAGSPAIDFGVDVGVTDDFGGRARPVGAPDVGAWERQGTD